MDNTEDTKQIVKQLAKVLSHSRRSKVTLLIDENIETLEKPLTELGYRVFSLDKGLKDPHIQKLAEGSAILTKNSKDFIYDAVRFDYDVIGIELIKYLDTTQDANNITARKISKAITDSGFYNFRGNFHLKIYDDGTYDIVQL
jgi:hypothetical protein